MKRAHSPPGIDRVALPAILLPQARGPAKKKTKRELAELGEDEPEAAETRLARFRHTCPKAVLERIERVMSQRFFCIDRTRTGEVSEEFKVLGSTGNVYSVSFNRMPSCTCPDGAKGNHCKHIIFVTIKVLGVPLTSNLSFQRAYLTSELAAIFAHAHANRAPLDQATERIRDVYKVATGQKVPTAGSSSSSGRGAGGGGAGKRLPQEGDTCPICYEDFTPGSEAGLVFCESLNGCGNGLHTECQRQWAAQKQPVTCVFCRADWPQNAGRSNSTPQYSEEGYLNLASSVGLSQRRDTSTYYRGPQRGRTWDGGYGRYGKDDWGF